VQTGGVSVIRNWKVFGFRMLVAVALYIISTEGLPADYPFHRNE